MGAQQGVTDTPPPIHRDPVLSTLLCPGAELHKLAVPHLAPSGAASMHRTPLAVAKVGQGVQPGQ